MQVQVRPLQLVAAGVKVGAAHVPAGLSPGPRCNSLQHLAHRLRAITMAHAFFGIEASADFLPAIGWASAEAIRALVFTYTAHRLKLRSQHLQTIASFKDANIVVMHSSLARFTIY